MKTQLKRNITMAIIFCAILPIGVFASESGHNHGHSHEKGMKKSDFAKMEMSHDRGEMFLKKKEIDGYTVSFHVMQAKKGMEHGGSHNFMIKIEKDGNVERNVLINSKVVHPNGKAESKKLMKMGDWYMNGYDLAHKGEHQLMILFKTSDGKKHKGGVYYSE